MLILTIGVDFPFGGARAFMVRHAIPMVVRPADSFHRGKNDLQLEYFSAAEL
jgi:hypothetical protein